MINKPQLPELCQDEFHDYIIELIRKDLQNIPTTMHCRRRDLAEALLSCNKETGNRERIKQELCHLMLDWSPSSVDHISKYGFYTTKGRTHYKLKGKGCAHVMSISTSPSDRKNAANAKADAARIFF